MKRFFTAPLVCASMAVIAALVPAAAGASTNDMIAGGCQTRQECGQKIAGSDLLSAYTAHGFTVASFEQSAVRGSVSKSGQVMTADGTVVATDAQSFGRTFISGSTKVEPGLFRRPTSVAFRSSPLAAFVYIKNGQFMYAVLTSCGNLVTAMPKVAPPAAAKPVAIPAPTPAATTVNVTQNQSQTQSQTQTQTAPAAAPAPTPAPTPTPAAAHQVLPQTGAAATGLAGLSVLATAVWYYYRGRRGLQLALRRR